ncbi:unnamed protein product [Closterium sp. NIES-53]
MSRYRVRAAPFVRMKLLSASACRVRYRERSRGLGRYACMERLTARGPTFVNGRGAGQRSERRAAFTTLPAPVALIYCPTRTEKDGSLNHGGCYSRGGR